MKTSMLTFVFIIYGLSVFATDPEVKATASAKAIRTEVNKLVLGLFDENPDILKEGKTKKKIIIFNQDFRKVREEVIDSMKEINVESTLAPVIYRSDLIASIDNVSYYLLNQY
jgi:hypothetical protein